MLRAIYCMEGSTQLWFLLFPAACTLLSVDVPMLVYQYLARETAQNPIGKLVRYASSHNHPAPLNVPPSPDPVSDNREG